MPRHLSREKKQSKKSKGISSEDKSVPQQHEWEQVPDVIKKLKDNPQSLSVQNMNQLQGTIGNQALQRLLDENLQGISPHLQRSPQDIIQRGKKTKKGLLEDNTGTGGTSQETFEPDASKMPNEPQDVAYQEQGASYVPALSLIPDMIAAASEMDEKLQIEITKKTMGKHNPFSAGMNILKGLQDVEKAIIKKVGRDDVTTIDDLTDVLSNPYLVTGKDVMTTEQALKDAYKKIRKLSNKLQKARYKIEKSGKKQNIKKNQANLQPRTQKAAKVGGVATDITASVVGSVVGGATSPFISPVGGAALGYGTKKAISVGVKKGVKKASDKKFIDKELKKGDADAYNALLGTVGKSKGKVGKKVEEGKENLKYMATKQGMKKEGAKKLAAKAGAFGAETLADIFIPDGGLTSAAIGGATSGAIGAMGDEVASKNVAEVDPFKFYLDKEPIEKVQEIIEDFLKATDNL